MPRFACSKANDRRDTHDAERRGRHSYAERRNELGYVRGMFPDHQIQQSPECQNLLAAP